ncbi:glycosyl hydrolase family 61-domain-containing protein [Rhexocercosporidium sp. MPI-PUGE-AT-0058]|nr:glycosyl hydrolase family 61-domain-containing protein [Rhexocercosporidium sp. MPI-PUGE-AT-0058]
MNLDIFWQLTYGGTKYPTYTYVRKNNNYNSPVTDLTSNDLRCNAGAGSGDATDTLAVKAGGAFTFTSDITVYHQGATSMYMAKAPSTAKEYDGSGQRWFKILEIGPVFKGSGDPTWPLWQTYTYRIPPATPNGEYLLRIEQLAIHNPGSTPQFYIGCAQISVTGGGNGTPGPLVAIPGHVKGTESGYTANIYNNFKSYTVVGPAIWAGQNDTSPVQIPTLTIISTSPPTTVTITAADAGKTITITTLSLFTVTTYDTVTSYSTLTETTTVTVDSGGSNNAPPADGGGGAIGLWNQCGGKDWTGTGTCVSGSACIKNSEYYSQCVAS